MENLTIQLVNRIRVWNLLNLFVLVHDIERLDINRIVSWSLIVSCMDSLQSIWIHPLVAKKLALSIEIMHHIKKEQNI